MNRVPWWGWLAAGFGIGALLVAAPVLAWLRKFLRSLDEATGWGGWSRKHH